MAKTINITDFKNLSNLRVKYHDRNHICSDLRPVYALNTDENGNITVLADNAGNYLELVSKFINTLVFTNKIHLK